jgi:ABC-type glutathione transport system ATPase component
MTGSSIHVRALAKRYRLDDGRELTAVDGVDLDVEPGEVVALGAREVEASRHK